VRIDVLSRPRGVGRALLLGVSEEPCPEDRSQSEARVGSMVWSTTASSSVERVSRSTWSRRRVENTSMVLAAWYLRRLNRRSTAAWMRRRAGWNRAAAARVAPATDQLGSSPPTPPNSWPRTSTTPA
jgi:hypothetical protein